MRMPKPPALPAELTSYGYPTCVNHIATTRGCHSHVRAAPYLLNGPTPLRLDQPSRLIRDSKAEERIMSPLGLGRVKTPGRRHARRSTSAKLRIKAIRSY